MGLAPRLDRLEKNLWINGAIDFAQRLGPQANSLVSTGTSSSWSRTIGGSASVTGAAGTDPYCAIDRLCYTLNTTASRSCSIQRSTDVPTVAQSGFQAPYSWQWTNTNSIAIAASDQYVPLRYVVEGRDAIQIYGGKEITFNFWFKSSLTGLYPVSFRNNGVNDRLYTTTFTVSQANVWEKKSITIQTDLGGTWTSNGTGGLEVMMSWSGTSRQSSTLNAWHTVSTSITTPSGVTLANIPGTAGAVMKATMFSIVEGDQAPTFSRAGRTLTEELMLCQRYYEKSYDVDVMPGTATRAGSRYGVSRSDGQIALICAFQVRKRATPTCQTWNPDSGASGYGSISIPETGESGTNILINGGTSNSSTVNQFTADAEFI